MTPFNATVTVNDGDGFLSLTADDDTEDYPEVGDRVHVTALEAVEPWRAAAFPARYGIPELNAMAIVHDAIKDLPEDAQRRVLVWAGERFGFEMKVIGP